MSEHQPNERPKSSGPFIPQEPIGLEKAIMETICTSGGHVSCTIISYAPLLPSPSVYRVSVQLDTVDSVLYILDIAQKKVMYRIP